MVSNVDTISQGPVIHLPQQVAQRAIPGLERQIDDAIVAKPPTIDLAFEAVQIIDSAGLNWLISVQGRLETLGIRLRVVDPSPIMADILTATRLDSRFNVQAPAHATGEINGNS